MKDTKLEKIQGDYDKLLKASKDLLIELTNDKHILIGENGIICTISVPDCSVETSYQEYIGSISNGHITFMERGDLNVRVENLYCLTDIIYLLETLESIY